MQLIQVDYEATIVAPEGVEEKAAEKRLQQELWAQQRRGQLSLDRSTPPEVNPPEGG